jgi:hypothetical protein
MISWHVAHVYNNNNNNYYYYREYHITSANNLPPSVQIPYRRLLSVVDR